MAVKAVSEVYHGARLFTVEGEGATPVDVMSIPAGTLIKLVCVRVKTATTNNVNLRVGDDDTIDGFILAVAAFSAGALYGFDVDDFGSYLKAFVSCGAAGADARVGIIGKFYTAAKTLKLVLTGAGGASPGIFQVMVELLSFPL